MPKAIQRGGLLFFLFILGGCVDVEVTTGIDENHTAFLVYHIQMDTEANEIHKFFHEIKDKYEALGFAAEDNSRSDRIDVRLFIEKEGSNFEEAKDNLQALLHDPEMSFLLHTDITLQSEQMEHGFTFKADTDVPKILDTSFYQTLPRGVRRPIEEGIETSNITFKLHLPPGEVVQTNGDVTHGADITQISFPVSLTAPSEFDVDASWHVDSNSIEEKEGLLSFYKILLSVFVTLLSLTLFTVVYLMLKKKKGAIGE